ncbi:DNA integrity scanning diadenylate cyclase DisA [Tissierella sp. MSJ-40]|uniref:DNA integrity scanning diadenylate cyclase DisA n=1 Tax=Tissierella simiarum TaxID=2841534 RepID=A0ABS6E804_9FIRM|nr:DNA integrity scanning diadenylate cyclase DisA [Tissierella simiarum]MBU5438681.1 DNA integrity scanning diadenylate cyclase DisA [Tissierella simiarum]
MENSNHVEKLFEMLRIVAPGTELREGLDNILRARTGALIVIGDSKEVLNLVDDGFYINSEYSPAYIYELAKMDGAIVISKDCKKILYANTQLNPCQLIVSKETGTRHKTAEKVAKQTNELVVAISKRRNIITLYKSNFKYILRDIGEILSNANQAVQTLEKYKSVLDEEINNLTTLEFENLVTLYDIAKVMQRMEMVRRIECEINIYIYELGIEGRLLDMQVRELVDGLENERVNLVKDYLKDNSKDHLKVWNYISGLSSEELLNLSNMIFVLGYDDEISALDKNIYPRGYRIMGKIPKLPLGVLENTISMFGSLQGILKASLLDLCKVEGIGEVRAKTIKEGLRKQQEKTLFEKTIIKQAKDLRL